MEVGLGVRVPASGAHADVVVQAPAGTRLSQVAQQLLAAVLPEPATGALSVGGHALPPSALLGLPPLLHGTVLDVDATAPTGPGDGTPALHVIGGPGAGQIHPLAEGEVVIGRAGAFLVDDPDVSRAHCRVRVTHDGAWVEDLGSTNGTQVDGGLVGAGGASLPFGSLLQIGSSTLTVIPAVAPAAPVTTSGDGTVAYNRPPRLRPSRPVVQVVVPPPPAERERSPLPVLAVLAPLVLGVVMWQVLGNATFLLFTLLSPVLVIGTVVTERRTGRRQSRRQRALWQAQRQVAERTLTEAVDADEQLRRRAAPDAATLLATARGPLPRLWERRRDDDDFLLLRIGLADQLAAVEADGDVPEGLTTARSVPAVVPLTDAGVLGVAGPRPQAQALARHLVTQAAVLHSPRDLQIVVITDAAAAGAWEWLRWLPHTGPGPHQQCWRAVGLGRRQAGQRVAELQALIDVRRDDPGDRRPVLLVVDGARSLRALPGLATVLAAGPELDVFTIALDEALDLLPEECGATAVLTGPTSAAVSVADQDPLTGVRPDLVTPAYAEEVARALAPLRDSSRSSGTDDLPTSLRWTEVVDLPLTGGREDVARILDRWALSGHDTRAVLGRGPDGDFAADIARDGPHALVAGTTGAGKSELLQTLIASLVVANRPDQLHLVLVDYKGGAAFGPCRDLPHTVGMVTDLDGGLVERALASLTAELRRRESVLAAAHAKDLDEHRRRGGELARLVIVVDEFASLAEELPEFVHGLIGIAQRGRSLGVHLVLATQRPEGVVSADIRANTNLRLCLAVTRDSESRDVIDSPLAASISRRTPGRAYARTGHADLTPFQTARVGGRRVTAVAADVTPRVTLSPAADAGDPAPVVAADELDEVTDLALLVAACRAAADRLHLPPAPSPWLPPLPAVVALDDVDARGAVLGLCDVPEAQARRPLVLDLDTSTHLLVAGSPRSGRTTALRTLAGSIARSFPADDVHLYAIDLGGALGALAALPHTGAVVQRDETSRIERLLTFLSNEVPRRQAVLSSAGHAGIPDQRAAVGPEDRLPHLLLLLDRWEAFVATFQDHDGGRLIDQVHRLLREGPAAGLHVVLTCDRSGLVGRVSTLVPDRVVLRLADRGDYAAAGLPTRLVPEELPPGRGWSLAGAPVVTQLALLDPDPSGPAQLAALQRIADAAAPARHHRPRRIELLPPEVRLRTLPVQAGTRVTLGVGGDELQPVVTDLGDGGFLVAGPTGSGRSTALRTIADQLAMRVVAVAPRPSPLRALGHCHTDRHDAAGLEALLGDGPVAVLVDDAELLVDSPLGAVLERVVREARDRGSLVVAAGTTDDLVTGYRGFAVDLRRSRCGVLLSPQSPADGDLLGVRLSRAVGGEVQPGRGLLARRGRCEPLQVALPG